MTSSDLDLQDHLSPQARGLISFLCPRCDERLSVPTDFAGVAGPCPACFGVIRAPRESAVEELLQHTVGQTPAAGGEAADPVHVPPSQITTSEYQLPTFDASWDVTARGAGRGTPPQFSAVKKIETPLEMEDGWQEKVEKHRKMSKSRKRRDQLVENITNSSASKKFQKIGICAIAGILVVTIAVLYLDRRGGNTLLRGMFSQ